MSQKVQKNTAFRPKKIRRSVKLDRLQASDFLKYPMVYCCEQCSFFDAENCHCTMGYPPEAHMKENQLKTFEITGHMAFCRFLEID